MNDLPVIRYLCYRKEFWDRQGANIASRKKEMYGVNGSSHSFLRKVDCEETTLCHTFLSGDLQCLPPGDPRILCDNIGI